MLSVIQLSFFFSPLCSVPVDGGFPIQDHINIHPNFFFLKSHFALFPLLYFNWYYIVPDNFLKIFWAG